MHASDRNRLFPWEGSAPRAVPQGEELATHSSVSFHKILCLVDFSLGFAETVQLATQVHS